MTSNFKNQVRNAGTVALTLNVMQRLSYRAATHKNNLFWSVQSLCKMVVTGDSEGFLVISFVSITIFLGFFGKCVNEDDLPTLQALVIVIIRLPLFLSSLDLGPCSTGVKVARVQSPWRDWSILHPSILPPLRVNCTPYCCLFVENSIGARNQSFRECIVM